MPLSGPASATYGMRFETKWTVRCLTRLISGDADSVRLVPPGEEGEGCEFVLKKGNTTEFHQVKRQHTGSDAWSVSDLGTVGVLKAAFEKTADPNAQFIFVSAISCGTLDDLTDSARRAQSFKIFQSHFLTGSRVQTWKSVLQIWAPIMPKTGVILNTAAELAPESKRSISLSSDELRHEANQTLAYDRLCRMWFLNEHENFLDDGVETVLRSLVAGDPIRVRNDLFTFVFENVHATIRAETVWTYLENLGHVPSDYGRRTSVLLAVQVLNSRYGSLVGSIGPGVIIPREEAVQAFKILLGSTSGKTSVLVSGEAGSGKTGVLGQVIQQIKDATVPHIYVRIDTLSPVKTPQLLAEQLGLPDSPVNVLAGIAKGRPCVLVVDQLDAVSKVSGRNPDFFDCIHEMIREARVHVNMHLLMACRQFDLQKDNRLRELVSERGPAQEITVKSLSIDNVKTTLQKLGCSSSQYTEPQLELLRLPLHIALFAEAYDRTSQSPLPFSSSLDLFRVYWENKRSAVRIRIGGQSDQWKDVVDRLCSRITERQTLFVAEEEVLDDYERTVRAMESEGVLKLNGQRIGFFHEGFFDYVFARRFLAKGGNLIQYLKDGEQDLFKRAPMRQILLHEHDRDHNAFVALLSEVVRDPAIRFHLKKCAMEAAAKTGCATEDLWELLSELIRGSDLALAREASGVLNMNPAWFSFLQDKGILKEWLASSDQAQSNRAMFMIQCHIKSYPSESVALLTPYVGVSAEWDGKILHTIWHRILSTDRCVFDLFLKMVRSDAVAMTGHLDFWSCIYDLPKSQPIWAAEAAGLYFNNILSKTRMEDIEWHFLPQDGTGERLLPEIAANAPGPFLDNVLPFFINVVSGTGRERDEKLRIDRVWSGRMCREEPLSMEDATLVALETALRGLAEKSPQEFKRHIERLIPFGDYDSVNFLIVRALSVAPSDFADFSIEYLMSNSQRLECGWPAGGGGDFSYWAARELVEHASKSCSDSKLSQLEQTMLKYSPRWERSKHGYKQRGYWQLVMLPALAVARMSQAVKSRIDELKRKFPDRKIVAPIASKVRCVGSPIETSVAAKMTDEQWLRAIVEYNTEDGRRRRPEKWFEGGAYQLSGVLEAETKRDPERFSRLSSRFPEDTHPYYFHAILRGLKCVGANKETVFTVVRRFHGLPNKPGDHCIIGPIVQFSKEDIPEDILQIVGWLATEAEDPKSDEPKMKRMNGTEADRPNDLITSAINSVRGTAAEAVGTLLFDSADRVPFFLPYLERMVQDPTVTVRSTVAMALMGLYRHNEPRAVELFLRLSNVEDDAFFATHHVDRFIHYAMFRHFDKLRPILRRMLDSEMASVRDAGSCHACVAQFSNASAKDLVDECMAGDDSKRKGAARVAEANVLEKQCIEFSHPALVRFFDDPAKDVRDAAARCFFNTEGRQLETCRELIRAFAKSKAFAENMEDLMIPLEHSTADIAEELTVVCEGVIRVMREEGSDVSRRAFGQSEHIAELLLRAYKQSTDNRYRSRCLDLIDQLLSMENYGVIRELEAFER